MKLTIPIFVLLLFTLQFSLAQNISNVYNRNGKKYLKQIQVNDTPQYYIIKASQLKNEGKPYDALYYLSKALELDGTDPNIYYLASKCYKALNNTDSTRIMEREALIAFEQGHYLKVSPYYMYHDYGISNLISQKYEVAKYCFSQALQYKQTAIAYHNLGTCNLYLKDYENACENWNIAIANGRNESEKLMNIWCKDCNYDSKSLVIQNDSSNYIDFYPKDKDTLIVILYFNQDWELTSDRTLNYRIANWITSKQMFDGSFADYIGTSKIAEGIFYNGKLNGVYTSFFNNTKKRASTGFMIDNKPYGKWIYFYHSQHPRMEIDFNGDQFEVVNAYDRDGNRIMNAGNGKWKFSFFDSEYKVHQIQGYSNNLKRIKTWIYETEPGGILVMERYNKDGILKKRKISQNSHYAENLNNGITSQVFIDKRLVKINHRYTEKPNSLNAYSFLNKWK